MFDLLFVSTLVISSIMLTKLSQLFGVMPTEVIDAIIVIVSYVFGLLTGKKRFKTKKDD